MNNFLFATLMKSLVFVLVLLVPCSYAWSAEAPRDPYQYFFSETFGDFKEELAAAKAQGKKGVLIFFEMDECPFCHYMKENVLNQPSVQAYFRKHFLNFSVDVEGDLEIVDFAGIAKTQKTFAAIDNRVRATPVFGFFDLEGNRMSRFIGKTSGVEEFMWLGEYVAEAHYKTMPFLKFKRMKKEQSEGKG
ncbi:MAG: thioredoxin fold domain-containing protein [Gammaproteobacteria bacterium]|nr:thioredoxin fold domain-containing protein [Gammaproteobacteria bacterium]